MNLSEQSMRECFINSNNRKANNVLFYRRMSYNKCIKSKSENHSVTKQAITDLEQNFLPQV